MIKPASALTAHNQKVESKTCNQCPYNAQYTEITGESFANECDDIKDGTGLPCGLAAIATYEFAFKDAERIISEVDNLGGQDAS